MDNLDKDFEKAMELFLETNQDKLGVVGRCEMCGGIVGWNFVKQMYVCMDCLEFAVERIEEVENWRIDGKENQ